MSFTAYHYTRKTWEKEVFELLFDTPYLYALALPSDHWQPDDQLSQHVQRRHCEDDVPEKQRAVYEPRAGSRTEDSLLKRLVFVIYASEKDQYQKNMTEIQGLKINLIFLFAFNYIFYFYLGIFRMYFAGLESHWVSLLVCYALFLATNIRSTYG